MVATLNMGGTGVKARMHKKDGGRFFENTGTQSQGAALRTNAQRQPTLMPGAQLQSDGDEDEEEDEDDEK